MKRKIGLLLAVLLCVFVYGTSIYAANNSTFNQTITDGTLSTDILDATKTPVANPSITMTPKVFSFTCYGVGDPSLGTLGTDSQRLYVINPGGADAGWNLSIAATDGVTAMWQTVGNAQNYDYNDPSGTGCTDGGDPDTRPGQMLVSATPGTITTDCGGTCTTNNINKGSGVGFEQGVVDSVNLLFASGASDDYWMGYLTGVTVSQTIPASQAADNYTINMTLTVVAS